MDELELLPTDTDCNRRFDVMKWLILCFTLSVVVGCTSSPAKRPCDNRDEVITFYRTTKGLLGINTKKENTAQLREIVRAGEARIAECGWQDALNESEARR